VAVKMRAVRAISRKGSNVSSRILRDFTPDVLHPLEGDDKVRSSWRHEELGRNVRALGELAGSNRNERS
jgi:hypothetical protein